MRYSFLLIFMSIVLLDVCAQEEQFSLNFWNVPIKETGIHTYSNNNFVELYNNQHTQNSYSFSVNQRNIGTEDKYKSWVKDQLILPSSEDYIWPSTIVSHKDFFTSNQEELLFPSGVSLSKELSQTSEGFWKEHGGKVKEALIKIIEGIACLIVIFITDYITDWIEEKSKQESTNNSTSVFTLEPHVVLSKYAK